MKFNKTKIDGVYVIDLEKRQDDRGFLARTWGSLEFKDKGIDFDPVQGYITLTKKKGTIRGIHYQKVAEKKLTRVTKGGVFEVVIDLRPELPTFKKWEGFNLFDSDYKMLYIPPGCAHAILTIKDNTEFISFYSPPYDSLNERGIRYNDPSFDIKWPIEVQHVSDKDLAWEDFY